jgi:hypothetical protein
MRLIKNWRVADATRTPIWEGSGIAALLVTELKAVSQALRLGRHRRMRQYGP